MAKKGLDISKFKKTSCDAKTATLQHADGHKITILMSKLSPEMRKQMEDLPVHKAEGGAVPDVNKREAKEFEKGATSSGVKSLGEYWENLKAGVSPSPKPQNYAKGTPDEPVRSEEDDDQQPSTGGVNIFLGGGGPQQTMSSMPPQVEPQAQQEQQPPMPGPQPNATSAPEPAPMVTATPGPLPSGEVTPAEYQQRPGAEAMPTAPTPPPEAPANTGVGSQPQQAPVAGPANVSPQEAAIYGMMNAQQGAQKELQRAGDFAQRQLHQNEIERTQILGGLRDNMKLMEKEMREGKINPNRFMEGRTDKDRTMMGLGLLLSGIGSGLQGHGATNMAADWIDKQVDRDIKAQEKDRDSRHSLLKHYNDVYGNEAAANAALRSTILDTYKIKVETISSQLKNPEAQLKAIELMNNIEKQKETYKIMAENAADLSDPATRLRMRGQTKEADDLEERTLPNVIGKKWVTSQKIPQTAKDEFVKLNVVHSALAKLITIGDQLSLKDKTGWTTTEKANYKAALAGVENAFQQKELGGVMRKDDITRIKESIGDESKLSSWWKNAKELNAATLRRLEDEALTRLHSYNAAERGGGSGTTQASAYKRPSTAKPVEKK